MVALSHRDTQSTAAWPTAPSVRATLALLPEEKANKQGYKSEGEETAAMVCARSTGAARKWWNGVYASRFVTFAQ